MSPRLTIALCAALALAAPLRAGDAQVQKKAEALLAAAFGPERGSAPPPGRALFAAALDSTAFVGAPVGPFDVRVRVADGLKKPKEARRVLEQLEQGLQPVADFVRQRFSRPDGLVSGRRFTLVFASSDVADGESAYAEILALLDTCEDAGWSGWKPELPVWAPAHLTAPVAQTWEVLVFNLAHAEARADPAAWLQHGVGYRVLNFLGNLLLQFGAYGPVPPWLQQGLSDELDIAVYGQAWVAAGETSSWSETVSGWSSTGWEGFLPEGATPPPPVYTPPEPLSSTFEQHVENDGWIARADSATRHWSKLAGDLRSEVPPSLQRAAAAREDNPRDRAFARLVLHLLLRPDGRQQGEPDLLEVLDRRPAPVLGGIRGGAPLTDVFADVLGGVPDLEPLAAQPLREQLQAAGRPEVIDRVRSLGAADLLDLEDHREQSAWLYHQVGFDPRTRQALFDVIVQSEQVQQLREWEVLGAALDRAATAALGVSRTYPKNAGGMGAAVQAFHEALRPADAVAPR